MEFDLRVYLATPLQRRRPGVDPTERFRGRRGRSRPRLSTSTFASRRTDRADAPYSDPGSAGTLRSCTVVRRDRVVARGSVVASTDPGLGPSRDFVDRRSPLGHPPRRRGVPSTLIIGLYTPREIDVAVSIARAQLHRYRDGHLDDIGTRGSTPRLTIPPPGRVSDREAGPTTVGLSAGTSTVTSDPAARRVRIGPLAGGGRRADPRARWSSLGPLPIGTLRYIE